MAMSIDATLVYYIAGPMSGIPRFNIPMFRQAATFARAQGLTVISPAELDSPAVQEAAFASEDGKMESGKIAGETWGEMLARDVKIVADKVQGLILLPGWEKSRGARLEVFTALLCDHQFMEYFHRESLHDVILPQELRPIEARRIRYTMVRNLP
jgi:hypothetical protein